MTTSSASGAVGAAAAGPPDKAAIAREAYFNQPEGFPFDNFDIHEVVLPPDDDLGIESDDGDVEEEATADLDTGFGSALGAPLARAVLRLRHTTLSRVMRRVANGTL